VIQYTRSRGTVLAVMTACLTLVALTSGQEVTKKNTPPPAALKKGDEVIALRVAPLQVETKTVATVRTGDKLVIEEVQGDWLWVHTGETRGWVDNSNVMGDVLLKWYQRQPDMVSRLGSSGDRYVADESGRAKAKILGVTFEIAGLQPGARPGLWIDTPAVQLIEGMFNGALHFTNDVVTMPGYTIRRPRDGVYVAYQAPGMAIQVERLSKESRSLEVNRRLYGIVQEGDHVLITKSRDVFVNGLRRQARG
jgi:hypothetical protein